MDIARDSGFSKPGLCCHFRSKPEFQAATIDCALDILEHEIRRELVDSRSDEGALRRRIQTHAVIMIREDDAAIAILADDATMSLLPADRAQIACRKRAYLGQIRERLERLAAAGKLRDIDVTTATHTLVGMVL